MRGALLGRFLAAATVERGTNRTYRTNGTYVLSTGGAGPVSHS